MTAIQHILSQAECLYTFAEIDGALDRLAEKLTQDYTDANPVFLCVMNGAVMTMGHLLPKLPFPLQCDYIHATRYGESTTGGVLDWQHKPVTKLAGREEVLIEDIYDEGVTLQALRSYCVKEGAARVQCVALIDKQHDYKVGLPPEYIGLTVPNKYVFGFGMDYQGYWRNLGAIYAVKDGL